jgi:acyl CoA:acetate/3-ketoacid CoA transferase beta subunit
VLWGADFELDSERLRMLTREQIATRAARELQDGDSVFLDEGLARLVEQHLPEGVRVVKPSSAEQAVEVAFVSGDQLTPLGEYTGKALAQPANRVIVLLEKHEASDGSPAIRKHCQAPVAGIAHQVITNLAVFDVAGPGLIMREVAPGVSALDVQLLCDAPLLASDDLKVIHV